MTEEMFASRMKRAMTVVRAAGEAAHEATPARYPWDGFGLFCRRRSTIGMLGRNRAHGFRPVRE